MSLNRSLRSLVALALLVIAVLALGVACSGNPATPALAPTPIPSLASATSTAIPSPAATPTLPTVSPLVFVDQITGGADPLGSPIAFALDKQGNLYVADGFYRRVQEFDRNGKSLARWGSQGNGEGQFDFHHFFGGMAVDDQGNVYVTDDGNARIEKFDGNGKFLAQWGSKGVGDGQFTTPQNVVVDAQGNVYVSDFDNASVQEFDSYGKFLSKLGMSRRTRWTVSDSWRSRT